MRIRWIAIAAVATVAAGVGWTAPARAADLSAGAFTMTYDSRTGIDHYILHGRLAAGGRSVVTTASGYSQTYVSGTNGPMTITGKGISGACLVSTDYTQDPLLGVVAGATDVLTCVVSISSGPSAPMTLRLVHVVDTPYITAAGPTFTHAGIFTGLPSPNPTTLPAVRYASYGTATFQSSCYVSCADGIRLVGHIWLGGRMFTGTVQGGSGSYYSPPVTTYAVHGSSPSGNLDATCSYPWTSTALGRIPGSKMTCRGSIGGGPTGSTTLALAFAVPYQVDPGPHGGTNIYDGVFAG